jgi:hypothetical protein
MKREFRPDVTPLEGRALMSAGLKGTLSGSGPPALPTGNPFRPILFFLNGGKLGKVKVQGHGWFGLGPLPPNTRFDFIVLGPVTNRPNNQTVLYLESIAEPVISGRASGPVKDLMRVTQAKGPYARYLGTLIVVSITEVPRVHGRNLSVSFSPA